MLLFLLLLMLLLLFLPRSLLLLLLLFLWNEEKALVRHCGVITLKVHWRDHDATPCVKSQSTFSACSSPWRVAFSN